MGQMFFPGENGSNNEDNDWKYGCGFIAIIVLVILYFCGVFDDKDSEPSSNDTSENSVNIYNDTIAYIEYVDASASCLTVIPSYITCESEGGTYSFQVKSSHTWRISTDTYDWGHIERSGNRLTLRIDENKSQEARADYFEVSSGGNTFRVDIDQKGSPLPYLNLSSTNIYFPACGGETTLDIDTNMDWYVSIDTKSWGHLTQSGNKLKIRIEDNPSRFERDDYFTITAGNIEETVYITQKGLDEITESNEYSEITARFQEIWVDHNITQNGNKGMIIHVKFDIYGMFNKTGQCAAYFYFSNGNPLIDYNQSYRTSTGNVATHVNFTPDFNGCTFNDLRIFMPYSELHLNNNASCYFTISLWNDNTEIAKSEKKEFNISFD